jgi:hypothetical protein
MGFNCIDHTVMEFHPINNDYIPGDNFFSFFRHFEFGKRPGDFNQIKAWKNFGQPIYLAQTGGHEVQFENRRVYPYKFLLKHYQIRSQSHGEKKVLKERKSRWNIEERAKGWHKHYDNINESHSFIRSPFELEWFDETVFNSKYLIERLSGIGIKRAEIADQIVGFKSPSQDLKIRNTILEARNENLESYLLHHSPKWWVRCIVFVNRLLRRMHRLYTHAK